ncbi:MAG: HlyD family efflux transporter periplasmic adaptor subunit [Candidatus Merdivicinus sp.]
MNDRIIRIAAFLLSIFLIVYVGVQLAGFTDSGYTTQTVYEQTVTQSLSIQGVFVREEVPIPIDSAGKVVSPLYSVGTKVAINTQLGSIYQDTSAVRAQYRAQNLTTTISALEKAQASISSSDVVRPDTLNGQIAEYTSQLITMRDEQDFSGIQDLKGKLTESMAKRAIVVDGVTDYSAQISALQSNLTELQTLADSQTEEFTSTAAGYFVDHVDGYEETMTREYVDSMTASQLQEWLNGYTGYHGSQEAVKIVSNHRWMFAAVVNEEQMQTLSNIGKVTLRFPGMKEDVTAEIVSAEREESTGLYKIEMEGDLVSEALLSSRVQTAEIIIREYKGIKIPKDAIRFLDGQKGVYVQTGNKIYFQYIDQIYETTDYVLSKSYYKGGTEGDDYVKLYDTVVVKGKGLYDEMLIQ